MPDLGPHLLGRKPNTPDERDWSLDQLRSFRDSTATLSPGTTLQELHDSAPATGISWRWWMRLWRAFRDLFVGPAPVPPSPAPGPVRWNDPRPVLDQGNYGTCVGNGWAQWGNTSPVNDDYIERDARSIYYDATCIDSQCDNPDAPGGGQQGSQVRSGAKAMQNRGKLAAYAFVYTKNELVTWLEEHGPIVIGSDWTNDMFNPVHGFVRPTGGVAGGHCYLLTGYEATGDTFSFLNSWGAGWGDGGSFYMTATDFMRLLYANGDACCALET